jgi:hypothetical protein
MFHRLAADETELQAEDLQETVDVVGATPVSRCDARQRVRVAGTLRTVTLRPHGGVPALEAELWDGSGSVALVFLGRRRIAGIEPGRCLVARGRLSVKGGQRTIYNPLYDLVASDRPMGRPD